MGPLIRFGRYHGYTVDRVAKLNPGWLVWFLSARRLTERHPFVALEAKRQLVRLWSDELDQARGRGIAGDLL